MKVDETVLLRTDDYTIYDDTNECDGIDAHLAITHDDTYVIGTLTSTVVSTVTASFASGCRSQRCLEAQGNLNFLGLAERRCRLVQ